MRKTLALAFMFVVCAAPAAAWSLNVHALICELSWDLLDEDGKQLVMTIRQDARVTASREAFGSSCKWADSSRKRSHKATYEYHFLNVVNDWSDAVDVDRDCAAFDCAPIAIQRYAVYIDRLKSPAKKQERELALRFLGHFVADLHQPLHSGHASDLGGNRIRVKLDWKTGRSANSNLHSLWDGELPTYSGIGVRNRDDLLQEARANLDAWADSDVWQWGIDSYELAKEFAYRYPSGAKISSGATLEDDYRDAGAPVAHEQALKAAVRLAHLLNELGAGRNPYNVE